MQSVRNTAAEDKSKESGIKLANRKLGMHGYQVSVGVREEQVRTGHKELVKRR